MRTYVDAGTLCTVFVGQVNGHLERRCHVTSGLQKLSATCPNSSLNGATHTVYKYHGAIGVERRPMTAPSRMAVCGISSAQPSQPRVKYWHVSALVKMFALPSMQYSSVAQNSSARSGSNSASSQVERLR